MEEGRRTWSKEVKQSRKFNHRGFIKSNPSLSEQRKGEKQQQKIKFRNR